MKRILFIFAALFAVITMNAQEEFVVAEIDWTAQSSYYNDVWYSDMAEVSVVEGVGLIINCLQPYPGIAAFYSDPQVPIIAKIPKIEKGHNYVAKFDVNAPAAGRIHLDFLSWDGSYAIMGAYIDVAAGDNDFRIDFPDYPTDCTNAMVFYQCAWVPGKHVFRKVQVLESFTRNDETGITQNEIMYQIDGGNENSGAVIFDLQGNRLNYPRQGLNIIRMSDGTTKKVVVK